MEFRLCLVLWLCFCTWRSKGDAQGTVCPRTERRTADVNETVEFRSRCNCEESSLPTTLLEVHWFRNAGGSDRWELVRRVMNEDWAFTVGERDGGVYKCQCEPCGVPCSLCYKLMVDPYITYFSITPRIARDGEQINVTCTAVGYPLPNSFRIVKEGRGGGTFGGLQVIENMITGITNTSVDQSGEYHCAAMNERNRIDLAFTSVLVYKPPWIVGTRNQTVRIGMVVYLECEVQGTRTATANVTWLRNGEVLSSHGGKYQPLDSPPTEDKILLYLLRVSNLTEDDIGEYVCKVGSEYNETEDEATVFILPLETTVVSSATTSVPPPDVPGDQNEDTKSDPTGYISIGIGVPVFIFVGFLVVTTIVCLYRKRTQNRRGIVNGGAGQDTRGQQLNEYGTASATVSSPVSPDEVGATNSETPSVNEGEGFDFSDNDTSSRHSGTPSTSGSSVALPKGVSTEDASKLRRRVLS